MIAVKHTTRACLQAERAASHRLMVGLGYEHVAGLCHGRAAAATTTASGLSAATSGRALVREEAPARTKMGTPTDFLPVLSPGMTALVLE